VAEGTSRPPPEPEQKLCSDPRKLHRLCETMQRSAASERGFHLAAEIVDENI